MSFKKTFWIGKRNNEKLEREAKITGNHEGDIMNEWLARGSESLETRPDTRFFWYVREVEESCEKCKQIIPAYKKRWYTRTLPGAICETCHRDIIGDKDRIENVMKHAELKEEIRAFQMEEKRHIERTQVLNHKEKLQEVLNREIETEKRQDGILKKTEELQKLEDDCIRHGYETEELKTVIEEVKKVLKTVKENSDALGQEIGATRELVMHLEDFDKRHFVETLKKRRSLKELSEESH